MARYACVQGILGGGIDVAVWACDGEAIIKVELGSSHKLAEVRQGQIAQVSELVTEGYRLTLTSSMR